MERSRRKRKTPSASNAHYVGYVEDEESVESIMKKFEELERMEREVPPSKIGEEEVDAASFQSEGLTEQQLEELFRRTSAFTVEAATNGFIYDDEWFQGDETFLNGSDDSDAEYDSWDEEFQTRRRFSGRNRETLEERAIRRYREALARNAVVSKPIANIPFTAKFFELDPSAPTYVRLPANPIPRSWARRIRRLEECATRPNTSLCMELDMKKIHDSDIGRHFSAILIDPPVEIRDGKRNIDFDSLNCLNMKKLASKGFLFVWADKMMTMDVVKWAMKWGYKYVENIAWIQTTVANHLVMSPSSLFAASKETLLMFRKDGSIELRHQRNPDCIIDSLKPRIKGYHAEQKPVDVYEIIETLLPAKEGNTQPMFLELWARPNHVRSGWVTISAK